MNLESLGRTDRELIERWSGDIEGALNICADDDTAARLIMQRMHDSHRVNFSAACLPWIRNLVAKWRRKTPDVKQQTESIALALFAQYTPKPSRDPGNS